MDSDDKPTEKAVRELEREADELERRGSEIDSNIEEARRQRKQHSGPGGAAIPTEEPGREQDSPAPEAPPEDADRGDQAS